jgi:hypothetical protein
MVVSTLYTWLPTQVRRAYGMPLDRAAGATTLVILAGFGGMIAFAQVADRAALWNPRARLLVPAVLAMVSAILLVTAFAAVGPGVVQFVLVIAGGATMTAASGPVAAVMVDVVHPALRAIAISTMAAVQNLLGLAVGPVLAGWLSDLYCRARRDPATVSRVRRDVLEWIPILPARPRRRPGRAGAVGFRIATAGGAAVSTGVVPGWQPPQLDEFEAQGLDAGDVPVQRGAVDNSPDQQGFGARLPGLERVQSTQRRGCEPARDPEGVVSVHVGLRFEGIAFLPMVGVSG